MTDIHTIFETGTSSEIIEELAKPGVLIQVIGPRTNYPPGIELN